jgi:DNA-binding transcriptional MerR regulator
MEKPSQSHTICQLARLAGVSIRTLHHYDQISLLHPTARTTAGYRLYAGADLLRLQQILFFKELDLPLNEIKAILDDPGFDALQALRNHRRMLEKREVRLALLLKTIDKTILTLTEETMTPLTDKELYEGFTQDQIDEYTSEASQRWPDQYAESNRRISNTSREQWQAIKKEGEDVNRGLAALMEDDPASPQVQSLVARHYAWVAQFWTPNAEAYRGLGQMYVDDARFRANYDKYRPGLADFLCAAMQIYAQMNLK